MPDGTLLKGAQGSIPFDRIFAEDLRAGLRGPIEAVRILERGSLCGALATARAPGPPGGNVDRESWPRFTKVIPAGVIARHRASPFYPVQVPDLIGVKDRQYLDHTGLQLHRSIADLMRYAALNQGVDFVASFNGFIPLGGPKFDKLPEPDKSPIQRYSDEQLYALALFHLFPAAAAQPKSSSMHPPRVDRGCLSAQGAPRATLRPSTRTTR